MTVYCRFVDIEVRFMCATLQGGGASGGAGVSTKHVTVANLHSPKLGQGNVRGN